MVQMSSMYVYVDRVLLRMRAKKLSTGDRLKNVTSDQMIMNERMQHRIETNFSAYECAVHRVNHSTNGKQLIVRHDSTSISS